MLYSSLLVAFLSGLIYEAPTGWTPVESSSRMRVAQWELPSAGGDGDTGSAEAVIFFFGEGGGGGVDANLDRWFGQFEQPDGSSTRDGATVTRRETNGLKLTIADMRGIYVAPVRPGSTQRNNRPNHRMVAAVVEGDGGPWYVRVLGPEDAVARWESSIDAFLSSFATSNGNF